MLHKDEQIRGTFLGLAYGDVIGCPTESMSQAEVKAVFGRYDHFPAAYTKDVIKQFPQLRPLGEHSDDTQQAMALTLACLQPGGYRSETFAGILARGYTKGAWRGFGSRFSQAMMLLNIGTSYTQSGTSSAGIGAAMRVAPAAVLYHDQPEQLKRVVAEQSAVTHGDIRAMAIAYAVSYPIAQFLNHVPREKILETLPGAVFEFEDYVINQFKDWNIQMEDEHEVSMILSYVLTKNIDDTDYIRERILDLSGTESVNDPFALAGGIHAIVMAMQSECVPQEQIFSICELGYDTDTVAAMAGAIMGARFGCDWIDTGVMTDLKRIEAYAQSLISKKPSESAEELFIYEKRN